MSRPRIYFKHELPGEVVSVAVAVIVDYDRRARAIRQGVLSEHLLSWYTRYNDIVDEGLSVIEEGARREMLSDIVSGRGYEHSMIAWMYAKDTYYSRKRELIYRVARGLGLCE